MSSRGGASTFAKGLQVLDCFESGRTDLTMAEIARLTGFDRATTRRLCLTLEDSGYITKSGRVFALSPRVLAVTGGYLSSHGIGKSVQPLLNQCAEELDGEISLAVREGTRAIYVAHSAVSSARLSYGFSIGSTLPLLPTALGRMLLAQCQNPLRERLFEACEFERHTEFTDMDPASVRVKIERAAEQGYAYAANEFERGAAGVSVPVSNIGGVQAVLATTASAHRLEDREVFDRTLDTLRRAAVNLGH